MTPRLRLLVPPSGDSVSSIVEPHEERRRCTSMTASRNKNNETSSWALMPHVVALGRIGALLRLHTVHHVQLLSPSLGEACESHIVRSCQGERRVFPARSLPWGVVDVGQRVILSPGGSGGGSAQVIPGGDLRDSNQSQRLCRSMQYSCVFIPQANTMCQLISWCVLHFAQQFVACSLYPQSFPTTLSRCEGLLPQRALFGIKFQSMMSSLSALGRTKINKTTT